MAEIKTDTRYQVVGTLFKKLADGSSDYKTLSPIVWAENHDGKGEQRALGYVMGYVYENYPESDGWYNHESFAVNRIPPEPAAGRFESLDDERAWLGQIILGG